MSFPGTYNVNYYYGDTLEFRVFPKNSSGEPFNLATFENAKFTIAPNRNTPVEDHISCFAQIDPDKTNILCAIRPQDAENLIPNADGSFPTYVYDVEISKPVNGSPYPIVYTLLNGSVSTTRDVTRPTTGETDPEVTLPPNPTNLVLSSETDTTLSVSWTAPTSGAAPSLYKVAAIAFTETLTDLEDAIGDTNLSTASTSFTFTGLTAETGYSVIIRSVNSAGDASIETILFNSTAFSTAAEPPSVPSAPVINSINELNESLGIVITVPEDGGSPITNYKYSTDGTSFVAFDPAQTKPTAVTFAVTVQNVNGSNKYFIDGVDRPNLTLYKGVTYTFDQSNASNATHQIYLSETEDGTHGGGTEYTTGATYTGTAGTDGSFVFEVPENAPATLYYVCVNHSGMGVPAIISVEDFSLIISGLTNGTSYPITIKAVNSVGDSDASNSVSETPEAPAPDPDFVVTNSGTNAYLIDGASNDTITLVRGETYVFEINATGHPFWIQDSPAPYDEYAVYNDGISDNGTEQGTMTWIVAESAPNTLYYACQFHSAMAGVINIIDGAS